MASPVCDRRKHSGIGTLRDHRPLVSLHEETLRSKDTALIRCAEWNKDSALLVQVDNDAHVRAGRSMFQGPQRAHVHEAIGADSCAVRGPLRGGGSPADKGAGIRTIQPALNTRSVTRSCQGSPVWSLEPAATRSPACMESRRAGPW
jgi:hypothetical protein